MLDPQVRALLDFLQQRGIPPIHTMSVPEARTFTRDRRGFSQPEPADVAAVIDLAACGPQGPIPIRVYRPIGTKDAAILPALMFFHGGGWTLGDLDTYDGLCRDLANLAGCVVVSVDYRLAPEHRFPAAVHDCIAATRWVHEHAAALCVDPTRIAVGGDSAGGNLAAVVAIDARDGARVPIVFQMLIYPSTDMSRSSRSHVENGQGYWLTRDTIEYFMGHYIPDPADYTDWRASPLLRDDLSNLPPGLVLTAGFDPLRDEGAAYARRLTEAGGRVTYVCFPRQMHGFVLMGKLIDEAGAAITLCAAELRRAFARATR